MAVIEITRDTLTVRPQGLGKWWALKSAVSVPLAAVRQVEIGAQGGPAGVRAPGTHVPGVITAGTYRSCDGKVFWDVRNPANALVLDLEGADYRQLVVEVEQPERTADAIRAAIG